MKVRCEDCVHFKRNAINPEAAAGFCGHPKRKEPITFYPMALHECRAHEPPKQEPHA